MSSVICMHFQSKYTWSLHGLCLLTVWFEPTDVRKAGKVFQSRHWTTLGYVSPNMNELQVMSQASGEAYTVIHQGILFQLLWKFYSLIHLQAHTPVFNLSPIHWLHLSQTLYSYSICKNYSSCNCLYRNAECKIQIMLSPLMSMYL